MRKFQKCEEEQSPRFRTVELMVRNNNFSYRQHSLFLKEDIMKIFIELPGREVITPIFSQEPGHFRIFWFLFYADLDHSCVITKHLHSLARPRWTQKSDMDEQDVELLYVDGRIVTTHVV